MNVNKMQIGRYITQPQGYKAFIPGLFPPTNGFHFSERIIQKASTATLKIGKLDGITQLLPDMNFFLFMYIRKDAASSSQIEGTKATLIDSIEAESNTSDNLPDDVDDILHYIHALNYGMQRLEEFPLSLRLIREIHEQLMKGARSSHFSDPGNFRTSQNWIGGTRPDNARFVPPPPQDMNIALSDLEKFLYSSDTILPIIKIGLAHAQFETIHPFLDGNGRTGRMLITLYLRLSGLLESPILFLSWYFKKNQSVYYQKLAEYTDEGIEGWLDFFLDGVIETSAESIEIVKKITDLRQTDILKVQTLGKTAAKNAALILPKLFEIPIINVAKIQEWTGFTRQGAQKTIDRFVGLGILEPKDESKKYGRSYIYKSYLNIFE